MKVELGAWDKTDIPALVKYADNIKVWSMLRDIFPSPYAMKDAEEWIKLNESIHPPNNFSIKIDAKTVGGAGVIIKDDVYRKNAEIGYWLAEPFWGKGIATIAIGKLTEYAFENFDVIRIYAEVFSNNPASMKVLAKNGYSEEAIHRKAIIKNDQFLDAHLWVKFKPGE